MRFTLVAFGVSALAALLPGPGFAHQPNATTPAVAGTRSDSDQSTERLVCRGLVVSGSRMPKQVCATKTEWAEKTKHDSEELQDGQQESDRRSLRIPGSGGQ